MIFQFAVGSSNGGYTRTHFDRPSTRARHRDRAAEIFPFFFFSLAWDPRRDIALDRVRPDARRTVYLFLSLPPFRVGFPPTRRVPSIRNSRMPRHGLIPRPWIITFRVVLIALAGLIGELT